MYGFDLKKTDRKKKHLVNSPMEAAISNIKAQGTACSHLSVPFGSLSSSCDLITESVAPRKPIGSRLESRWRVASSHFVYSHFVEAILKSFIISFDQILIGNRNLFRFIKVKVIRCSFFCNNKKQIEKQLISG